MGIHLWRFEQQKRYSESSLKKMARFVNSGALVLLLVASFALVASAAPKPSDWRVCGTFSASRTFRVRCIKSIARVWFVELRGWDFCSRFGEGKVIVLKGSLFGGGFLLLK